MMTGLGMGFGWFGIIVMVLFWAVIVGLGVWLLGQIFPGKKEGSIEVDRSESPIAILKKRFARGEISQAEYEEIRHGLEQ